jgi:hypothetical protein
MKIPKWLCRSKNTPDQAPPPRAKRTPSASRRPSTKTKQPPDRPRREQYDSDFITRYGDPFD